MSRRAAGTVAAALALAAAVHLHRRRRQRELQPPAADENAEEEEGEDVEALLRQHLPFINWDEGEADLEAERAELLTEQLSRNEAFLGVEAQAALAGMCVTVVGLGATGSHAAQLLARTGVGRLRLIDPAVVRPHSLRTSALAVSADLGRPKAAVVRDALLQIVPQTELEVVAEALDEASAARWQQRAERRVLAFLGAPQLPRGTATVGSGRRSEPQCRLSTPQLPTPQVAAPAARAALRLHTALPAPLGARRHRRRARRRARAAAARGRGRPGRRQVRWPLRRARVPVGRGAAWRVRGGAPAAVTAGGRVWQRRGVDAH